MSTSDDQAFSDPDGTPEPNAQDPSPEAERYTAPDVDEDMPPVVAWTPLPPPPDTAQVPVIRDSPKPAAGEPNRQVAGPEPTTGWSPSLEDLVGDGEQTIDIADFPPPTPPPVTDPRDESGHEPEPDPWLPPPPAWPRPEKSAASGDPTGDALAAGGKPAEPVTAEIDISSIQSIGLSEPRADTRPAPDEPVSWSPLPNADSGPSSNGPSSNGPPSWPQAEMPLDPPPPLGEPHDHPVQLGSNGPGSASPSPVGPQADAAAAPIEAEPWSPLQPPPGESPLQPHARQWDQAPDWAPPPPTTTQPSTGYSWHVPARRQTQYDGPMYTSTGEIREAHISAEPAPAGPTQPYAQHHAPPHHPPNQPPAATISDHDQVVARAVATAPVVVDQDATKSGASWGRFALIVAVLALAGGAAFAVRQALSTPAGPASAQEAVDRLIDAVENEDMIGLVELWSPAEREALLEPTTETLIELDRLENTGDQYASLLDFDGEPGLPANTYTELRDLTYEIEEVGPGVHYLVTTGGTLISQGDPKAVPEWIEELIGEEATADSLYDEVDLAADPIKLAVVEEDGSWYFSLFYSLGEALRRDASKAAPGFEGERLAVGADTPKEAVEEMMRSMVEFDFIGALNRLDPVEFEALYDYRELFDPDIQELMDQAQTAADEVDAQWELTRIVTSTNDIRDQTTVGVELIEATVTTGDGDAVDITMQDGCLVAVFTGEGGIETIDTCDTTQEWATELPQDTPDWVWQDRTQFNFRVVERDGRWYLAGGPTVIGNITDQLAAMSPAEWQDRKDFFTDFWRSIPIDDLENLEPGDF